MQHLYLSTNLFKLKFQSVLSSSELLPIPLRVHNELKNKQKNTTTCIEQKRYKIKNVLFIFVQFNMIYVRYARTGKILRALSN